MSTKQSRTSTLGLSHSGSHFARTNTDHAKALRLIERTDLLLGLTEYHAVLEFAQLGLSICFFSFARSAKQM
jgi:hypothetical protein